jgi:hypothetical protein
MTISKSMQTNVKGRARCCPEDLNVSEFAELRYIHSLNIGGGHVLEEVFICGMVVVVSQELV